MDNCVIPHGYKATALGIIPQEWEVMLLGNLSNSISSGRNKHRDAHGQYPVFGSTGIIGYSSTYEYEGPVILVARVGANAGTLNFASGQYDVSDNTLIITIKQNVYDYNFAYNQLTHYKLNKLVFGSGQPLITSKQLKNIRIPVPPLAEQRKIAEVLGVWDEAIEKQARLIEKLALRKRALMQRLLSAKLRLPGFSEPWKKVNYSDILKEVRRTLTWDENELYDLISVRRRSGGVFHRESLYGHEIKTKTLRPALEGDFLISKMQIVHGASGVVPKQLSGMKISGSYIALIAKDPKELNINYFNLWSQMPLFYHQTFVSSYGVHIEKMTFDLDAFMSLSMNLPPIEEQNRIVEVISTATNEIELAKEKLERLRRQKRGLMQQLLTGKRRIKY